MRRTRLVVGWLLVVLGGGAALAQDSAALGALASQVEAQAVDGQAGRDLPASWAVLFSGDQAHLRDNIRHLAAQGAHQDLVALTRSGKPRVRANAAWGLGLLGLPDYSPAIAALAGDPQPGVRYAAAWALAQVGGAPALRALNDLAADTDDNVRAMAIESSGNLRDAMEADAAEDQAVRIAGLAKLAGSEPAQSILQHKYGALAVPALLPLLTGTDRVLAAGAAATLAKIGDASALQAIATRFADSVTAGKPEYVFAQALSGWSQPEVWPFLKQLLASGLPAAEYYGLVGIGDHDNPERLTVLRDFLQAQVTAGTHKATMAGDQAQVNALAYALELIGRLGDASFNALLNQIIGEAPTAEQSLIKPLAEAAVASIAQRG